MGCGSPSPSTGLLSSAGGRRSPMGWDCGSRRPLPQSPAAVPTIRRLRNGKGCSKVTPLVDDRPKAASQKGPVLPKALPTLDATWPLTPPLHQDAPREHSGSGAPKPPSLRAGTGHPVHHSVPRPRAAPDSAGETSVGSIGSSRSFAMVDFLFLHGLGTEDYFSNNPISECLPHNVILQFRPWLSL